MKKIILEVYAFIASISAYLFIFIVFHCEAH